MIIYGTGVRKTYFEYEAFSFVEDKEYEKLNEKHRNE